MDLIIKCKVNKYIIIGDIMPYRNGPTFYILCAIGLSILIFYQLIITFILPFRYNIFILFVEIFLFWLCISRILWC